MVASNYYELEQLDVTTTFLNGMLEEEIFIQQSKGFIDPRNKTMCVNSRNL